VAVLFALNDEIASLDKEIVKLHRADGMSRRLATVPGIGTLIATVTVGDPAAFATGRDPQHGAVAVTTGLRQRLSVEELAGVLALPTAGQRGRVGPHATRRRPRGDVLLPARRREDVALAARPYTSVTALRTGEIPDQLF
jgi:hypothetical protein